MVAHLPPHRQRLVSGKREHKPQKDIVDTPCMQTNTEVRDQLVICIESVRGELRLCENYGAMFVVCSGQACTHHTRPPHETEVRQDVYAVGQRTIWYGIRGHKTIWSGIRGQGIQGSSRGSGQHQGRWAAAGGMLVVATGEVF